MNIHDTTAYKVSMGLKQERPAKKDLVTLKSKNAVVRIDFGRFMAAERVTPQNRYKKTYHAWDYESIKPRQKAFLKEFGKHLTKKMWLDAFERFPESEALHDNYNLWCGEKMDANVKRIAKMDFVIEHGSTLIGMNCERSLIIESCNTPFPKHEKCDPMVEKGILKFEAELDKAEWMTDAATFTKKDAMVMYNTAKDGYVNVNNRITVPDDLFKKVMAYMGKERIEVDIAPKLRIVAFRVDGWTTAHVKMRDV